MALEDEMADSSNTELLRICTHGKQEYTDEALAAAAAELESRRLSPKQLQRAETEVAEAIGRERAAANAPLERSEELQILIDPAYFVSSFIGQDQFQFQAIGQTRKAQQARILSLTSLGVLILFGIVVYWFRHSSGK